MSPSYEEMNRITSFGFYPKWRRSAVDFLELNTGDTVTDLMTGIGECWEPILRQIGTEGTLTAIDFSTGMLDKARQRKQRYPSHSISVLSEDVLENSVPSASQNAVICAYGLKTLSTDQAERLFDEIIRILQPEGRFCLVDIKLPQNRFMSIMYLFYIARIIPLLAILFKGDKKLYKMLGVYIKNQKNLTHILTLFKTKGATVHMHNHFYGCAYSIYGKKL